MSPSFFVFVNSSTRMIYNFRDKNKFYRWRSYQEPKEEVMRGFKEIREIREIRDEKREEEEKGYLEIKPETNITFEEACAFWDNLFSQEIKEEPR